MACQDLGLALGSLGELAFEGFGDTGLKRSSRLAQQRAVLGAAPGDEHGRLSLSNKSPVAGESFAGSLAAGNSRVRFQQVT